MSGSNPEDGSSRWDRLPSWDESLAARFYPLVTLKRNRIRIANTARVDAYCKLEGGEGVYIGEYVHLASYVHILGGGACILEDGASCGSGVKIITGSNVPGPGHGCSAIAPDAVVKRSQVHIGKNATLFVGAIILPGITIGDGAVVGAGAVVTSDVPAGETWVGNPARPIRKVTPSAPAGAVTNALPRIADNLARVLHGITGLDNMVTVEEQHRIARELASRDPSARYLASYDELCGEDGDD